MRYASNRGALLASVEVHANRAARAVRRALNGDRRLPAEERVSKAIEGSLREAFEAGRRQGAAETKARLGVIITERVRKAVEGIKTPPAPCPHCDGGRTEYGPCEACAGTGNFRDSR